MDVQNTGAMAFLRRGMAGKGVKEVATVVGIGLAVIGVGVALSVVAHKLITKGFFHIDTLPVSDKFRWTWHGTKVEAIWSSIFSGTGGLIGGLGITAILMPIFAKVGKKHERTTLFWALAIIAAVGAVVVASGCIYKLQKITSGAWSWMKTPPFGLTTSYLTTGLLAFATTVGVALLAKLAKRKMVLSEPSTSIFEQL